MVPDEAAVLTLWLVKVAVVTCSELTAEVADCEEICEVEASDETDKLLVRSAVSEAEDADIVVCVALGEVE